MVKGISRRVIVVDSPDPRVFDQAIFILRRLTPAIAAMLGGGLMGLVWLVVALL